MKKLSLPVVAALFLATGTAHAEVNKIWRFNDYKRCTATTEFKVYPLGQSLSAAEDREREKEIDEWPSAELMRKDPALGPRGGPAPSVLEYPDTAIVVFKWKHLAKLEAAVRFLKKCRIWVWDHHRGKAIRLTPKETKEMNNAD
jgi:hypothetical protein